MLSAHRWAELAAELAGEDDLLAASGVDGFRRRIGERFAFEGNRERCAGRELGGLEAFDAEIAQAARPGFEHEKDSFAGGLPCVDDRHAQRGRRDGLSDCISGTGREAETFLPG